MIAGKVKVSRSEGHPGQRSSSIRALPGFSSGAPRGRIHWGGHWPLGKGVTARVGRVMLALKILLVVCSTIVGCRLYDRGVILEITQQQIQERLAKRFPISRDYLVVLRLTLSDPEVILKEGSDRIGFGVSATTNIKVKGEDLRGKVGLTSDIRYEREEGTLLLVNPKVEQVAISLMPQRYEEEFHLAANLAAAEFLEGCMIYKLNPKDLKQRLAKLVLQEVVVKNGVLRVKLGVAE